MAVEETEICLLWGDLQVQQWWSCMTHSDWAAWVQAVVVSVTLILMSLQFSREKKKVKAEINAKRINDAISIKYYLRQHNELVINLDVFMSSYEMQFKQYQEIKKQANIGAVVEEAIGCFMQPARYYEGVVNCLSNLDFEKRTDLHLNYCAVYLDEIISGARILGYMFAKYNKSKPALDNLANGIFYFNEEEKKNYFEILENRHSEWIVFADSSHEYFMKIINGWKGINSEVAKISNRQK